MFIQVTAVFENFSRPVFVQVSHVVAVSTNNDNRTTILLSVGEDVIVAESVKQVIDLIAGR